MQGVEQRDKTISSDAALYYVALSMVPSVGAVTARQLINYCGTAEAVFSDRSSLKSIPGIGPKIVQHLSTRHQWLARAEQEVEHCARQGIEIITLGSDRYPERLRHIYDAPIVLFYKGTASLDYAKVISVVGTRQATAYGRRVTEELITSLSHYDDLLIVSGLAYGIDINAHRAALKAGLPTVGVMASGLDIIYPTAHRADALEMMRQGGLLTESPLGTKPDGPRFPARNRIIAGLCDAAVVVEAAEKGGALITAHLASDYDREVFAVPGSLYQKYARGCHRLIKEHTARLVTDSQDIVAMLNWDLPRSQTKQAHQYPNTVSDLNKEETAVATLLDQQRAGMLIDEISWQSQIPVNQLAGILLSLEFKQVVKALPGRKFRLR